MKNFMHPPADAPKGTVWFGGPVDRCVATLRVYGDTLDPDAVSELLGHPPTSSRRKGDQLRNGRVVATGSWFLRMEAGSESELEIDDLIQELFGLVSAEPEVWAKLKKFRCDIFCGIFMNRANSGFSLGPATMRAAAERGLEIGFDVYAGK